MPQSSDEAAPFVPPDSPGVVVDVLHVDLDLKGDWDFSEIPPPGVLRVGSSRRVDFSLIQDNCYTSSTTRPSNAGDVM